jgi:hypothetical protein
MPECGYVPTSSDRFEWFLPSVTEVIYASAKTLSLTQKINGTLEWGNLVHLFNYTCYQQYPHFQVAELQSHNKSKLSQNSLKLGQVPCPLHPDSQHTSAECKKLRELASTPRSPYPGGKGKRGDKGKGKGKRAFSPRKYGPWTPRNTNGNKKGKGYGGGKEKDKGNRTYTADTPNPYKDMECSHCGKKGHPARNCYKLLNAATTTVSQNNTTINEPTTIAFQQFGTFMKRKAVEQNSEDDDADNTVTDAPEPNTTDAPLITDLVHPAPVTQPSHNDWGSSSASFQPTWGNNDKSEQDFNDDEWGNTDDTATGGDNRPINYSPKRNPTRSGICCCCDKNICYRKMNGPLTCSNCRLLYEPKLTNTERQWLRQVNTILPPRAPDTSNQWPRELRSEQDREPRPQPDPTPPPQLPEHDDNEAKDAEHDDKEAKDAPVTTFRQNYTRLGVVFSSPRTLFAWQQRKDKGERNNITHQNGVIKPRGNSPIHPGLNPYSVLHTIQDSTPHVNIPLGSEGLWFRRPHKWSVAVLQHQRALLRLRYKQQKKIRYKLMKQIQRKARTYECFKETSTGSYATQICELLPVLSTLSIINDHHQDLGGTTVNQETPLLSARKPLRQHATKINLTDLPPDIAPSESDSDSSDTSDNSLTIIEKSYIRPEMNESSIKQRICGERTGNPREYQTQKGP